MRILLLLSKDGTNCAADYIRSSVGEMTALELDECFPAGLTRPGLMIETVADSFNVQDFIQVHQMAGYLCRHWYRYGGHDPTVWRDVSLGEIAEDHFYTYFVQLLHGLTLAKRCLEQYRPEQVVFCGATSFPFKQPFAYLADHMGILSVEHRLAQEQSSGKRLSNRAMSAVKHGMALRKMASGGRLLSDRARSTMADAMWRHLPLAQQACLGLRRWWRLRQREDRMVVMIPTFHNLMWLIRQLKKDKRFYVIELDRQKIRSLDWLRQNYLTRRTWHEIEAIRNGRGEYYEQVWSSMEADPVLQELFLFEGISYWPLVRDKLRRFVTSLGQGMTILEAQHSLLETERPHLLLFHIPFAGGQRSLVNLAHLRPDIQAAVYTEGAYFYKDIYRPYFTRVDYLLAWGDTDVEIFPELGYSRRHVKIIGQQNDLHQTGKWPHPTKKNAPSLPSWTSQRNGRKLIVYFDTTPWPLYLGLTQRLMETIAKLMALLPEYDLAFRPHPRFDRTGWGRTERRFAFVQELDLPNVYLTNWRQSSLGKVIHKTDLGITLGSAVIYDLLSANKPVAIPAWLPWNKEPDREISVTPEGELAAPDLIAALFVSHAPEDLVSTIRRVLECPEAWASKQEARQRFLESQVDSTVEAREVLLHLARTQTMRDSD